MAKWILAAGAAAIALSVPALAGPGNNNGGGPKAERGGGGAPKAEHGGDKAERGGGPARSDHDNGGGQAKQQAARVEHGNGGAKQAERQAARVDHGMGSANHADRQTRSDPSNGKAAKAERRDVRVEREIDRRDIRLDDNDRHIAGNDWRGLGLNDGCPPGLAKKDNGCLPPGQVQKMIGAALPNSLASHMLEGPYRQWYRDDDRYFYRNDGDYIYRVNRDGGLIDALFPYQDRDYSYYPVGMTYPQAFDSYNVPYQYQSFYPDGNDFAYRYGDGAIYQVNRSNNSISSIVALLAGDLGVGQAMPADYGVYNVPMAYRDRYYDTPEAMYRYNDGYIYRADPKTQLITAVIDALV